MNSTINLILIDDHDLMRAGLSALISRFEGVSLLADGSFCQVLSLVDQHKPDIVLLNLSSSPLQLNGNIISTLTSRRPIIPVLVIVDHQDDRQLLCVFKQGVMGCLLNDSPASELEQAIKTIHFDGSYLSPMVGSRIIQGYTYNNRQKMVKMPVLSIQQTQVLKLVSQGCTNEEIARRLVISRCTAEMHVYKIFKKLNVNSRTQAIQAALRYGILDMNEWQRTALEAE